MAAADVNALITGYEMKFTNIPIYKTSKKFTCNTSRFSKFLITLKNLKDTDEIAKFLTDFYGRYTCTLYIQVPYIYRGKSINELHNK